MVNIYSAMCAAMSDVPAIMKNRNNAQQGFKFRGIDDVYNELHDILAKHKIFTVPEVLAERTEERQTKSGGNLIYRVLTIKYTFYTDDGSCITTTVIGEGMDSGDKAANKAMAIAHKYALFQAFLIPTDDPKDPDAETHEVKPKNGKEVPGKSPGKDKPADFEKEATATFKAISDAKAKGLHAFLGGKGIKESHAFASQVIGREIKSFKEMNDAEADKVKQAAVDHKEADNADPA